MTVVLLCRAEVSYYELGVSSERWQHAPSEYDEWTPRLGEEQLLASVDEGIGQAGELAILLVVACSKVG